MRSLISILFALVSIVLFASAADQCQTNQYVNGCSIPLGIHLFYQDRFTPSCNRHDICYYCADFIGKTKSDCDETFLHNMYASCETAKRFILPELYKCKAAALTYYEAVKGFAGFAFEKPSPSWCSESWTRSCMFLS